MGLKLQAALALCDIGAAYGNQSDYTNSQNFDFKALAIYEELKNYRQMAVCNINIGVNYTNNNNFTKAIFYANKTLQLAKKTTDHELESKAYEIIGNAYASLGNNVKAREYYLPALAIYKKMRNDYGVATVLSLLMSTYSNDYQKQLDFGLKAQLLWNKIAPDHFYSINILGNLGSAYGQMAMHEKVAEKKKFFFQQSKRYLSDAINRARKTNTKAAIIDFNDSLSVVNAATGNYKDAYANLKTSSRLYDSVYSQTNKNKIAALEGAHDIALKEKEIQINKLEIANEHKQRWFMAGGLLALLLIAGLLYFQSLQRKRTNTTLLLLNNELDEANKIKTKFFGILNHDLRGPIASFVNFLHLQQQAPDLLDAAAGEAYAKKATAAAENLLGTMEDLLLWSKGQMENFKPSNHIIKVEEIFADIKNSFNLPGNIQLFFEPQPGMQLNVDAHYLKTIMHNLTNNATKALVENGGVITWKAWEEGSQKYLSITDNGPGAEQEAFRALYDDAAPIGIKSGLGLHIVRDLAKAIGCQLQVTANKGEGVELQLKFS